MITQSSSSASTVSQNAGANNNVVVTTNTINSTVAAGNSSTFPFTGNVSVMGGIKPDQGKSPQYDNPNAINLNYQIGNWTWSLNGATEFTGMSNSSYGNAMGAGNQNTMLNTWGFTGGYNFQNGLTTSMNVSYLNWRSQSSSPAAGIFPVLVTGYQLAPTMTYVNGNSTYALAMYYQVLGSSNGILAVSSSAGFPPNGITGTWNGQNGESFSIFPMYTNQVSTAFSYSTGVQIQQANDNYLILTQAVDNDSNNNIILHPIMLSYNVASIPGLNLNLDTRYYYNNTVKNDPMQTNIGAIAGSTRVCVYPGIAYTKSITSSLSWVTNAQVYGKWYTNNMNGQIGQTPNGKGNISTNYGGQIYSGFNYSF
ncbi:MAG: hypothetical protein NTX05_06750 [Fusobacteria bacterium]|nr:hypothetical protein [Fusobacteriota bacterium]